jgi:hypothetical protein
MKNKNKKKAIKVNSLLLMMEFTNGMLFIISHKEGSLAVVLLGL